MKLKAFTMLEMMISLTLFGIVVSAVCGILAAGMNLWKIRNAQGAGEMDRLYLLGRIKEISRESFGLVSSNPAEYFFLQNGDQKVHFLIQETNIIIENTDSKKIIRQTRFKIPAGWKLEMREEGDAGRKSLFVRLDSKQSINETRYLFSYRRSGENE